MLQQIIIVVSSEEVCFTHHALFYISRKIGIGYIVQDEVCTRNTPEAMYVEVVVQG